MCVRDPISYLGNDEFLDTIDVDNYTLKNTKATETKNQKKKNRQVHIVEELVFDEELIQKIYK